MIAVLMSKSGNVYHYCTEKCCTADREQRDKLEKVGLDILWPKEL